MVLESSPLITAVTILLGKVDFALVKDLNATFCFFIIDVVVSGIKNGARVAKTTLLGRDEVVVASVSPVVIASFLLVGSTGVLFRLSLAVLCGCTIVNLHVKIVLYFVVFIYNYNLSSFLMFKSYLIIPI